MVIENLTKTSYIQPLGTRSAYNTIIEDPRKSIRGHIPMYNLLPVYIPCFLQALSLTHFISKISIKDQLFFYCPAWFITGRRSWAPRQPLSDMRLARAGIIHSRKKWHNLFCLDKFPRFKQYSVGPWVALQHLLKETCSVVPFRCYAKLNISKKFIIITWKWIRITQIKLLTLHSSEFCVSYLFVAKLLGASACFWSVLSISQLVLLSFKHKNDFLSALFLADRCYKRMRLTTSFYGGYLLCALGAT